MRGVYVAASSAEIDRATMWMGRLRLAGIEVTSSWPEVILKVGVANPMDASREQRRAWPVTDLAEVQSAAMLWLLCPTKPTIGAYVELGYAAGIASPGRYIFASGPEPKTIFTSIANYYATDEEAFEEIKKLHNK